jgi:uncharacterized protein YqjF (DUF2071 family)
MARANPVEDPAGVLTATPFLTARWEDLILLNYACPADLLTPLVPRGAVLDLWKGEALISLVGFLFKDTRVLGLPIPFHVNFEEVNLRFYVRRITPAGELRRAVVFVRELVPRVGIASVARWLYNEPYLAVPMSHQSALDDQNGGSASYSWQYRGAPFVMTAEATGPACPPLPGSEAEFITEHYWGYTRQRDNGTLEYQVEHPTWSVWEATRASVSGPLSSLYGAAFADVLAGPPRSAFVAVGSAVSVHRGVRLLDQNQS